jgi:membrane protein YdbS with pleckstrin-like domain
MSWTSIITALVLALTTAFLTIFKGWDSTEAFFVVCSSAVLINLLVLAIYLAMIPAAERKNAWQEFKTGFKEGISNLAQLFIKK